MKNKVYIILNLVFVPLITCLIYSCTGVTIEDCNCDDYMRFDTVRLVKVDTVYQIDTLFKGVEGPRRFWVQIGCFMNKNNAEKFANQSEAKLSMSISLIRSKDNLFRVLIGEYDNVEQAKETLNVVKSKGFYDAFIRDQYGPIDK